MKSNVLITAGVISLLQSLIQGIFSAICLAQYYCVVDFLRSFPLLLYIRILYFHDPVTCNHRVVIGKCIPELPNQALVLIPEEPFTVTRTMIINWSSFILSVIWMFSSMVAVASASKMNAFRWPWIFSTVAICTVDVVATVMFANDSFHTRTLNDIVDYIGGTLSGAGNVVLNTGWASWIMVLIYSRFVIFFCLNVVFIILVIIDRNAQRIRQRTLVQMEQPTQTDLSEVTTVRDENESTERVDISRLPRAGMNKSYLRMKNYLFAKQKTPSPVHTDSDKKRTVNFPDNLLSLPQRLENLIAEQQKRLDQAIIDTAGKHSPTRVSQSLPHLSTTKQELTQTGDDILSTRRGRRRSTVAELQGQLPWAYIEASANRMRDQLPPDEDLPPVPLPDYAAMSSYRKASVHRAASSLSSLNQKRDEMKSIRRKSPLTQSDVLY